MATSFDSFLPEVLPECPGVPQLVAINAIRNACFDFCKKSLLWNEVQDPVIYVAGTADYQLTAPTGAQIVAVLQVNLDETKVIFPYTTEQTTLVIPDWASEAGTPTWFVQPDERTVTLVPVPDTAGTFTPLVAYAPTRSGSTIDDRIYNLHLETIKYGALWKLKVMAAQPWSDPVGAAFYESRFWMGTNAAVIERNRGTSRASLRVQPRSFV